MPSTNGWKDVEHQITFDVRQPKTHAFSHEAPARALCESHPYVNVVRYTTFFHQFTLVFDELKRREVCGLVRLFRSASAPTFSSSLKRRWAIPSGLSISSIRATTTTSTACPARNSWTSRLSSGARSQHWPRRWWISPTSYGKEAMMFLGDHWIGTEPYHGRSSPAIGLDAVVGSVGNGSTLRLISDIPGVKYTEGRFLPYFFPDTFHEGGDPVGEAQGQLGDRPPRHPAQAHRPHRLRRLSEAGAASFRSSSIMWRACATSSVELYAEHQGRAGPTVSEDVWPCSTAGARHAPGAATWCTMPCTRSRTTATPA